MANSYAIVDLRSDTVTKPTPAMRRAMAEAEVGDDVYGEDPTVNRLQQRAADVFGREAALFVPTGCMGNLVAIKTWTRPGMEVICDQKGHINNYELASMSAVAGCMPRTAAPSDGILSWELIEPLIRPKNYYTSQTGLISLENTHNMHGGSVYTREATQSICGEANAVGLPVHMDGARIFNAAVALRCDVTALTQMCDSVMFCLSKGLGAPVGSILVGSRDFIERARVNRKLLGGGMRQAGVLAAAGLVALEESPKRLHCDHENAKRLAEGLEQIKSIRIDPARVVTNIVIFDVSASRKTAAEVSGALRDRKVLANPTGKYTIRMVTHCDVDRSGIERAIAETANVLRAGGSAAVGS
ncbi:MAG TPA: low-specificity L-threonine aldolase [Candidatus Acidoferrales bacterium]|nr:low-specificity L-threonine aldolase [Candidatus Acidoferrales bacterium]